MVEKLGNLLNLDSHQRPSWVAFYPINPGEGGFYAEAGKIFDKETECLEDTRSLVFEPGRSALEI